MSKKEWDVFISHASEDKNELVEPLASLLAGLGSKVWYDNFTLNLGDSLSRSIDTGLANSKFGLVVLSPDFLQKDWPEYELRGLVAKELGRDKVILPIWHNVDRDQVLKFSPPLADKLALKTSDHSIEEIGFRILGVVRPDLLENVHARVAYKKAIEKAERKNVDPKSLQLGPIRHNELSDDLVGRTRLIRAALIHVYPQTMEFWLDGFKRDMNPHKEIEFWEHTASCYLEYVAIHQLSHEQHKAVFGYVFGVANAADADQLSKHSKLLDEDSIELLHGSCLSKLPAYEISGLPTTLEDIVKKTEEELEELRKVYEPNDT